MAKKIVRVVGHKNPDTDSICAAIAYSFRKESKPQIKPENLTTWKMMPESSMIPKMT